MLTVIFGAGASYDSDPDHSSLHPNPQYVDDVRPPLARDLFDRRYGDHSRHHPESFPLFPDLREGVPNIEETLEKIRNTAGSHLPTHRALLSLRYYLKDVINFATDRWLRERVETTNYERFLYEIDKWQEKTGRSVSLITFNYDTMLDRACGNVLGINLSKIDSYIHNNTPYKIFKPHGSTNWFRKVKGKGENLMQNANKLVWTDEIITENELGNVSSDEEFVPAIAIPTVTKDNFEFPSDHKDEMIESLNKSTDFIVIGWRGAEEHFLKFFKNPTEVISNRRLQIVCSGPDSASVMLSNLTYNSSYSFGDKRISCKGFSRFMPHDLSEFLK